MAECSTQPSGSGTEQDPYIITDVCELNWVRNDLDAYYKLANDIDASDTITWNSGSGFLPIGTFIGDFDGQGYAITDLYVDWTYTGQSSPKAVGLFSFLGNGGYVHNLSVLHAYVEINYSGDGSSAHASAGILVGWMNTGSDVEGCFTSGTVVAKSDAERIGTAHPQVHAGGLSGYMTGTAEIRGCASIASVSVYSLSSDDPFGHAGGLVGRMYDGGHIYDSYARGTVYISGGAAVASLNAGGLVGDRNTITVGGTIDNCYSTGAVSGSGGLYGPSLGGLVGHISGTPNAPTDCFWDVETSGQSTSEGGTGKTTAEMKTESTFTDAGWDFDTIWDIDAEQNNGYPILRNLPFQPSLFGNYIWIEGTEFAYLDTNRIKRLKEGTLTGDPDGDPYQAWIYGNYQYYTDYLGKVRRILGTLTGLTGKIPYQISINTQSPMLGTHYCYIDSSGAERCFEGTAA